MDIVKSIALGAEVAGISGELLSYVVHGGYLNAKDYLDKIIYKMKILMLLLGKKNIEELKTSTDYRITGRLKDLV